MSADERRDDAPRMALRVYRIDRDGVRVEISSCVVRAGELPKEFSPIRFPPCRCSRCERHNPVTGLS
ncbi:hypothetical protein NGB36_18585 [Streptomyces sp. RB6PN25]|uniref:Uncharacterized protein n=1 Tax=Streptomyces humicola TaxID=2953240 RepID=A0ABT1PY35_9ACTN|nr:hypothetical protein [Streptomyces humicola]MCQ4082554.1 hypothetical protein [Streptomyces humicola]